MLHTEKIVQKTALTIILEIPFLSWDIAKLKTKLGMVYLQVERMLVKLIS